MGAPLIGSRVSWRQCAIPLQREAGTQVLDIFSEWKSLYIDYSGKLQKAQIDTVEI